MISDDELKTIISAIPRMSDEQREQVSRAMRAVTSLGGAALASEEPQHDGANSVELHLAAIRLTMTNLTGDSTPKAVLRKNRGFVSFAQKAQNVEAFLMRSGCTTRTQLYSMLCLAVELLYRDAQKIGISASAVTIVNLYHRIPAVIDQSFPGYARARMLGLIATAKRSKKESA